MEIINEIEIWSSFVIQLILLVYCLVKLRSCGGGFIAVSFGILLFIDLNWMSPIVFDTELFMIGIINFFLNIVYAISFAVGISKISSLINSKQENLEKIASHQATFPITESVRREIFLGVWFSIISMGVTIWLGCSLCRAISVN